MSTRAKVSKSKESTSASSAALSADQLRRKAKFQLLGSAVLVALGVVLFALLLDSPPRPNTNEVSILIPARDSLAPLALPGSAPAAAVAPPVSSPAAGLPPATTTSTAPSPKAASTVPAAPPVVATSGSQAVAASAASAATTASAKPPAAPAKAIEPAPTAPSNVPDAKKPPIEAGAARYVVQVGAFTDPQKIRDVRAKLERAGLKTYAQVVQTAEGQRTRVRVGPFATKAEADKVAAKIKSLDLPAALLTL